MTIPLQSASLYDCHEIFVWSNCLLDLGTDFLVGNMVIVWDVQYLAVASHFHGLYFSLEHEGRWTWQGRYQSYLGAGRNTPVIPNWFQPCQYCCCLCYPGEYLGLGTLVSYNWLKPQSLYIEPWYIQSLKVPITFHSGTAVCFFFSFFLPCVQTSGCRL